MIITCKNASVIRSGSVLGACFILMLGINKKDKRIDKELTYVIAYPEASERPFWDRLIALGW